MGLGHGDGPPEVLLWQERAGCLVCVYVCFFVLSHTFVWDAILYLFRVFGDAFRCGNALHWLQKSRLQVRSERIRTLKEVRKSMVELILLLWWFLFSKA